MRRGASGETEAAVAVEVDLGGEGLKNVFVRKLSLLRDTLAGWAGDQPAAIIVLTVGPRRIMALVAALAALPHRIPVFVFPLPRATGRAALTELRATIADAFSTS